MTIDFSILDSLAGEEVATGQSDGNKLINSLEKEREAHNRSLQVYREYQDNIKLSSELVTEIIKGVNEGQDLRTLFLKSCKVIAIMRGEDNFYTMIEKKI